MGVIAGFIGEGVLISLPAIRRVDIGVVGGVGGREGSQWGHVILTVCLSRHGTGSTAMPPISPHHAIRGFFFLPLPGRAGRLPVPHPPISLLGMLLSREKMSVGHRGSLAGRLGKGI